MEDLFNLSQKTILVTGGTGLLGNNYCLNLGKLGANVIMADLPLANPKKKALKISKEHNVSIIGMNCDVSKEADVITLFKEINEKFSKLDVVINNAAATGEHLMREGAPFTSFENSSLSIEKITDEEIKNLIKKLLGVKE